MSVSSDDSGAGYRAASKINDKLKIVSTQSTARPGAVVELEPIEDAKQVSYNLQMKTNYEYNQRFNFESISQLGISKPSFSDIIKCPSSRNVESYLKTK
jgi:hypothetical protein